MGDYWARWETLRWPLSLLCPPIRPLSTFPSSVRPSHQTGCPPCIRTSGLRCSAQSSTTTTGKSPVDGPFMTASIYHCCVKGNSEPRYSRCSEVMGYKVVQAWSWTKSSPECTTFYLFNIAIQQFEERSNEHKVAMNAKFTETQISRKHRFYGKIQM